ncbi:MAG TPA: protein-disulfide reductase DsbD [Caldimonas sp.]|nr:protein-disulfide reductase DsbD [Caldimonas sp.]
MLAGAWCLLALLFLAARGARAADEFLEPDQAFKVQVRAADARTVEAIFTIAPHYYLYREQFKFGADGATLGEPVLPRGKVKFDETFQKNVETYRDVLRIALPVQAASGEFRLYTTHQGCADAGLCYPPQPKGWVVSLAGFGGSGSVRALRDAELPQPVPGTAVSALSAPGAAATAAADLSKTGAGAAAPAPVARGDVSALGSVLQSGRSWSVIGAFFVAGLLLAFTPCVLPMVPIVSSIIAGHGTDVSRLRGFMLAAAYSLGMALVYTALGIAAGLAGEGLAAAFQQPWVLVLFAGALVAFAMSMFGAYELQLPSAFTNRMAQASGRLRGGRIAGVAAMGGISALIVSPCVAAPLAGALVYLSQTRDVWLGGIALFSLALGMSVPLLLVGASAGALLPKAGPWMNEVKGVFGVLLLGVALWTLQPVLPASLGLALWGALLIACAVLLLPARVDNAPALHRPWRRVAAAILGVCGLLQLVGAASGGTDPLQPLAHVMTGARADAASAQPRFATVKTVDELDAALRGANRPVMLDFYADWCVSCKEMERYTYSDPSVQARLAQALLLKADVTKNDPADRALLKRFGLFGPPGTIFFDAQGREVAGARAIGYQNTEHFLETLRIAGL